MTETQAKSGTAEAPANPDETAAEPSAKPADEQGAATGRASVVGRAAVPGDAGPAVPSPTSAPPSSAPPYTVPSASPPPSMPPVMASPAAPESAPPAPAGGGSPSAPKYTRAPGMPPPPDALAPPQYGEPGDPRTAAVTGIGRASVRTAPPATGAMRPGDTGTVPLGAGAARVGQALRGARTKVTAAASRGPRRARLYIKRVDPWSVMKFSFAVSFVLLIIAVVATSVLYLALDAMGVFTSVNKALADMVGATGGQGGGFTITAKGVIFGSALLGAVNVVLFTALATLSAFIYNVCADLVGGVELTLAEKE
jgi:transmembrane protein DUF3566